MFLVRRTLTASLMIALCSACLIRSATASVRSDLWDSDDHADRYALLNVHRSKNGRIAFVRSQDILTANADGTDVINLTNGQGTNSEPAYSPDGSRIAFVSDRDGNREIYTMNTVG